MVTLLDTVKRVELTVSMDKPETSDREGVYVIFPFALDTPAMGRQSANAVFLAGEDRGVGPPAASRPRSPVRLAMGTVLICHWPHMSWQCSTSCPGWRRYQT
ncbi:MAG TPA: hypothetical protein VM536_19190 [Chloroflexia bacterium]|nr:hypothetical protein [Chloroflexia bacterium]